MEFDASGMQQVGPTVQWGSVYEVEFEGPVAGVVASAPMPTKVVAASIEEAIRKVRMGWIQNDIALIRLLLRNVQY